MAPVADGKIDSLDTHLEQFKLNDQTRQNDLQNLLREYSQLLDEYKDLKKAYDEKGSTASHVAKAIVTPAIPALASAKPRNPYVLVLVDGNDYIFNDELIREKEEGGMRAARMLNDAVEKYLQQSVPQSRTARIIVRIYADLTNLSKQLAKSKVIGLEKRSISPFSAAFTRAISLFDFVDALDEEGTKFKIREQFKLASEDSACSHILYAACHDTTYLSSLVPFSGVRDKITLVQGAGWNPEFHQFNLNITQFPTLFRWSGLTVPAPANKATAPTAPKQKAAVHRPVLTPRPESWRRNRSVSATDSAFGTDDLSPTDTTNGFGDTDRVGWANSSAYIQAPKKGKKDSQLCKYFQKGFCHFGNKCNFQHVPKHLDNANNNTNGKAPPSETAPASSSQSSLISQPTTQPPFSSNQTSSTSTTTLLPTSTIPGFIPLNKTSHRLDTSLSPPTQPEWAIYNARFQAQKPCNNHHLQGLCTTLSCPYDHNKLEHAARRVLEYVLKCQPCPRKGNCRVGECFYGHLCQKEGCVAPGKGCKMKGDMHGVDAKVAIMVPVGEVGGVEGEEGFGLW